MTALLVKDRQLGVPDDEEGFAGLLLEHGLISREEKHLLDDLRGLRNRLVHRYGSIDDKIVHARVQDGLDEVEELLATFGEKAEN